MQEPTPRRVDEFVTETFEYDGGREVTVYVPPLPPEAIVFAGDGPGLPKWGRLLEHADVPSTMLVGVHRPIDEMARLHEYSPGFEPQRFEAHEKFFVEEVRRWTESRFGVKLPAAKADVVMEERAGRHGGAFWREAFPRMAAWAFGP